MRLSKIILIFLVVLFIGHSVYYYPLLPEMVASHFDASGKADNWMSKNNFFIFESAFLLYIIASFTFLPFLIEKLPNSMINLPNKDYWLAEERRPETFVKFRMFFQWLAVALLAFFIAVNHLFFRANIENQNLSNFKFLIILGLFLAFVFVWVIKFIVNFTIKK